MAARAPLAAGTYTTSGTTADVVTFGQGWDGVEVDNQSAADMWISFTGTALAEGDDDIRIPAGQTKVFWNRVGPGDDFSIVGDGSKYTVAGLME